jgi:hypothetical protein
MLKVLLTHARRNAVAYAALFVALGGTSYAVSQLPAQSVGTRELADHAVKARKLGRLPAAYAFTNTYNQSLSDGEFAAVHLARERFDFGHMHSTDNDTRLVAPRTGTYVVEGTASFAHGTAGGSCGGAPRIVVIQRHRNDGGAVNVDQGSSDTLCGEYTKVHAGAVVRLEAGEYVEMLALERPSETVGVAGNLSAAYVGG